MLAGLALLVPTLSHRSFISAILPIALVGQLVTIILVHGGMNEPYRQTAPLIKNDHTASIGVHRSELVLSKDFADYFARLKTLASQGGFKPGVAMVDMSGHSPGTLYALGAKVIGQPWNVGGYKGSNRLAAEVLMQVSCADIASAWILLEPDGPRKLSPLILLDSGIDLAQDYESIGAIITPENARSYRGTQTQHLLKPRRPQHEAEIACNQKRAANRVAV
jgi:hypothetical protein